MNIDPPNPDPKIHLPKWSDLSIQSLLNAAPDAMLAVNRAGRIVIANIQAEHLFGYTRQQLIGKSVEALIPPRLRGQHPDHRENFFGDPRVRPAGEGLELFALRADGSEIPVDISLSPLVTESGTFVITAIRDMTERRHIEELKKSEAVLRESEERFRSIANTAPVLIWQSGIDKQRTYFNTPWLDFTGRSIESALGNGWAEGVHPEDLQRCLETYTQSFDHRESFRMEYRLRRYDGEYRCVLDRGVPRFNQDRSFAGYIGIGVDITDRKLAEEALSGVTRRLIEAQELERARIARELHDDIGQRLALLTIELEQLRQNSPDLPAEARSRIAELQNQSAEIASGVQSLSHELHSSKLEYLGIATAMRGFCKEFSEQHKVEIVFAHDDIPSTVPQEISLCLFRVLQEALHNAVKHSGVRHFDVKLQGSPTEIHLTARDSGVGFDPALARATQGLGLVSMQERVRLLKGTISITSKAQSGTEISVRIPLSAGKGTEQAKLIGA
jgi:PAS domain S-box-containing protein